MTIKGDYEGALQSSDPVGQLRALALHLSAQGQDKETILERFEVTRQDLRQANREADEDSLMDVLDCMVGWCSPEMKLLADRNESVRR
jgi:hypothetical protein